MQKNQADSGNGAWNTNTDDQLFEAWSTTMSSVESIRLRMAGLSDEQQRAEFAASKVSPEELALVRAENDEFNREEQQYFAIRNSGKNGEQIPDHIHNSEKLLRYFESGVVDRETDLHIGLKEGATIPDDAFNAVRKLLADVRERIKGLSPTLGGPEPLNFVHNGQPAVLDLSRYTQQPGHDIDRNSNTSEQRYEAFNAVMNSTVATRERMSGLTEDQRFAEFQASEQGPAKLAEVRAVHDAAGRQSEVIRDVQAPALPVHEPLTNTEQFRYEAYSTVQNSVEAVRQRLAGLTEDQRFAEFQASEQGPAKLAEVRAVHDAAGRQSEVVLDVQAPALPVHEPLTNTEQFRYEAYSTVQNSVEAVRQRLAGLTEDQRFTEFQASEQGPTKLAEVRAAHDSLTATAVSPVVEGRLSNTDQQKFEAWQGVMGSLESEKPRMAILSDIQRRAEYEASQIGPERFQAVRAEHDLANGYRANKPALPEKGSLSHWANELTDAANKTRRPLSGSEFKQVVSSIESCSRGADQEKAKAREVAGLLAKVHGPSGEALFRDPELRNAYKAAISPPPIKQQQVSADRVNAQQADEQKNSRTAAPMRMR
ncbi:hypothetical protein [Pseudomonas sp. G(2018)]|uniref:hypothetical protein n=1 Tax=Pseudomonas sp. G(2018) TaxID=2502242 RepID=UPI0010F4AA0A|nr:hypothetical protein [Pseudomonas sp. G(2018)]